MKKSSKIMHFFLGSSSPRGFYSKFDSLYSPEDGWYCRILKGSPGCGKSSLLKKIAQAGIQNKINTEYIYCSADPESLDAVIFPEIKSCIVDGTAPHVLDPVYPGAFEHIINLGQYWNPKILQNSKKEIMEKNKSNINLHNKSKKYLAAFGALNADTVEEIIDKIDFDKIKPYAQMLIKKIFNNKHCEKLSTEYKRFISAVTPEGLIFYEENLKYFENIYELKDMYGIIGDLIIKYLRNAAINYGYDIITCFSPLSINERIECLLIPELSIAIVINGRWFKISEEIDTKKINIKRFYTSEEEPKLNEFNEEKEKMLIVEASKKMKKAKKIHDELENYYIKAMDFKALNKLTEEIISEIF
ncbi:MAG: hypothetical protein CfP315_0470 [Candidatus Improbicoccus pseudotrichonymphae]|uniref:ATPase n=1 Tax=Candidatus Improbicoccus pseudotrichonymphae TaxID=3033792 RepID=A0AA48KZ42_9FIRM|nr:MAG: hypothetical protein CfP315_0470 [Candidatus Improbicoccus pseudotrichonymphae]